MPPFEEWPPPDRPTDPAAQFVVEWEVVEGEQPLPASRLRPEAVVLG